MIIIQAPRPPHHATTQQCSKIMAMDPVYTEAVPYIDVTRPYFALHNISSKPSTGDFPTVSGTFDREQIPPPQNANSFCGSELGRHTAILGSLAAAYSNPVKMKHYYLALDAFAQFVAFPPCQTLHATANVKSASWDKRRVACDITIYTPSNKYVGMMKVFYAIMVEEKLLKIVKSIDPNRIQGTPWQSGESSPFQNPIMLRMEKIHSPELATAIISLHDRRSMAGHFSPIAAAPIAILSSNGIMLCRRLLPSSEKSQWLDRKTRVRCQRLAVAGEVLELRASRLGESEFSHRVEFFDEDERNLGTIDYLFVKVEQQRHQPKL